MNWEERAVASVNGLRWEHRALGLDPDLWCHSCTTPWPCDVARLLDLADTVRVMDRHYGDDLEAKYAFGWHRVREQLAQAPR